MSAKSHNGFSASRKKIIAAAKRALPANQKNTVGALGDKIFAQAPVEDLEAQSTASLTTLLQSARKAEQKGTTVLRIEDHDDDQTLLTVSMANRPFILDSVLADLADVGCQINLVLHPLIKSTKGNLRSLVLILVSRLKSEQAKSLKVTLKTTMDQIRLVTDDWQPMLARMGETVAELRTSPPPIPAEQIAEAVQFVEWLTGNNFTFMGMRELKWEGNRKTGSLKPIKGSSLGILKDPELTVMTRGRKPVVITPEIRDFLFSDDPLIITKANVRSAVHRRTHLDYIGIKRYDKKGDTLSMADLKVLFPDEATVQNPSEDSGEKFNHKD